MHAFDGIMQNYGNHKHLFVFIYVGIEEGVSNDKLKNIYGKSILHD